MKTAIRTVSTALLLSLIVICVFSALVYAAQVGNGTFGNLSYVLHDDGRLVISGDGEMESFSPSSPAPWHENAADILSLEVEDGVKSIGSYAFYNCVSLKSASLAGSVTSVGRDAFLNTGIYNDAVNWADGALYVSHVLVKAPDTIDGKYSINTSTAVIADGAFEGCGMLTGVTMPSTLEVIGDRAFFGCSSVVTVTVPSSVKEIGYAAFGGMSSLKSISVNSKNTSFKSVNGVLYSSDMSRLAVFPPQATVSAADALTGVKKISPYAFYGCRGIKNIALDNGVTEVGEYAFAGSTLEEIKLSSSMTVIKKGTFADCSTLKSVTAPCGIERIEGAAFSSCSALTDIYYGSTSGDWDGIEKSSDNNAPLFSATVHCRQAEETTSPVEETTSPVEETTSPVEETTPPVEETTPPVEETTPPVEETTPPVEETTPPVEETTPPVEETTPPVEETTPPAEETTTPAEDTASGQITQAQTDAPSEDTAPPAQSGTQAPSEDVFNDETNAGQTNAQGDDALGNKEEQSIIPSVIITIVIMAAAATGVVLFIRRSGAQSVKK